MNGISGMKHEQIITLCKAKLTASEIAAQLEINRGTVSVHLLSAGIQLPRGRPPSRGRKPAISTEVPADPGSPDQIQQLSETGCPPTPEARAGPPARCATPSLCEPHRAFIKERLACGQSAQVVWQDLVDERSFGGAYDSVKRFARGIRFRAPDLVGVMPTRPGWEAQVDYGRGAPTIHPETGKLRRPWLFCLKLSHSRKAYRKVVWTSSSRVWCELHEEGFRYFGGAPEVVVLDNLKEGVLKADIYDPELNPLYAAMLAYYGAVATPCRVATPRHKGKVESEVKYTQNALKGRTFPSIEEQQAFLDRWSARWADTRIHGVIKRQVQEIFEREEKCALKELPSQNFPILEMLSRRVHVDGHVTIRNAYYSVPPQWIARDVVVHVGRCFVDIRNPQTGERIARHPVGKIGRYSTISDHLPDHWRLDRLHQRLIERAEKVGKSTRILVAEILRQQPHHAIRAAQGVLALARKHSPERIEAAAALCAQHRLFTYRSIKKLIDHQIEPQPPRPELTQQHPLIRDAAPYHQLWLATAASTGPAERN